MIKATLSFLRSMMQCDAEMKLCSKSSHAATPPFFRRAPLFTRLHLPLGLLVGRCCLSLHHFLTTTQLWTCETPCNATAGDVISAWQEQAAQSGLPKKCGSTSQLHIKWLSPWGIEKRWLQQVITKGSAGLLNNYCKWRTCGSFPILVCIYLIIVSFCAISIYFET